MKSLRAFAWACFVAFGVALPLACSGGLVGGDCRSGYGVSGGKCVLLGTDAGNGGASDFDASADGANGGTSNRGGASNGGNASTLDGAIDSAAGGSNGSGGVNNGGASGGSNLDGGGATNGTGGEGFDACTPPYDTAEHCGSCNFACKAPTPYCSALSNGYFCTPLCTFPLTQCGLQCVNTNDDPDNCGSCGHVCPSEICQAGTCVGATAGHEVLLCMDYRVTAAAGSGPEQLLENAVFLGSKATVRILAYEEFTPAGDVAGVKGTLDNAKKVRNRNYSITVATSSADVVTKLNIFDYDLLLVDDQPAAPAGNLAQTGAAWATALDSFVRAGGTVVVLAGYGGRAEMDALLTSANLLTVTAQTSLSGNEAYNRAPGDAVGLNVLSQYLAPTETCTFTTPSPDAVTAFVVTDKPASSGVTGLPVVVHRVLSP